MSFVIPSNRRSMGDEKVQYDEDEDIQKADIHAPAGSVSHMMGLFASTKGSSNSGTSTSSFSRNSESASLLEGSASKTQKEFPLAHDPKSTSTNKYASISQYGEDNSQNPQSRRRSSGGLKVGNHFDHTSQNFNGTFPDTHIRRRSSLKHRRLSSVGMPSIAESKALQGLLGVADFYSHNNKLDENDFDEENESGESPDSNIGRLGSGFKNVASSLKLPTTYIGSFVYLLYHVVSCLSVAAAITRPTSAVSILGLMTKTAALGTLVGSPVYWFGLSGEVPALYPTVDGFLTSFLAASAGIVDRTLAEDSSVMAEDNDAVFLASFGVLVSIGMTISALLILAASVFRLANLAYFLPYPVIAGFFSFVGIANWTLALSVDTGGETIGKIISSGDGELVKHALLHHTPTIILAGIMRCLGPKNPIYFCYVLVGTIAVFHAFMLFTGTTLDEMKEEGWFWSHDDLVYYNNSVGFKHWAPPAPLGVLAVIDQVHWGAVKNGISTAIAMSFLYLIRCSVHITGLKKNISNLSRKEFSNKPKKRASVLDVISMPIAGYKYRRFSDAVDLEAVMSSTKVKGTEDEDDDTSDYEIVRAKPSNVSLRKVSKTYAWSQIANAIIGGFGNLPSGASTTMFALGADALAPQVGSVLLLFLFYLTDFQIVSYIPKPVVSSMLVLSFMEMAYTWFYKSFLKTKDKMEWIVVPIIVVCAFVFDLLAAVFLGVAMSTFIFVHAFFRSGVVKFAANGESINSTVERPFRRSEWLEENGDRIQVLCLQNYLFFGNASAIYSYIKTLFEVHKEVEQSFLKPTSKFLILDLTMVTGMDTSAVDVFTEIRNLCRGSNCRLFMAGISPNIRSILELGGFQPEKGVRSKRNLRFFQSLDTALGKAEDMLLDLHYDSGQMDQMHPGMRRLLRRATGFQKALRHIDNEHGDNFTRHLEGLGKYTTMVELQAGEVLYDYQRSNTLERGLFFIEVGILKVERNRGQKASRRGGSSEYSVGSEASPEEKEGALRDISEKTISGTFRDTSEKTDSETFRLARLGEGWVVGTMEFFHHERDGFEVALDDCKLHHLPFSKIRQVEKEDPGLVLELYKLLSYLMAERQEATIGQLATLHSIMSSPACS